MTSPSPPTPAMACLRAMAPSRPCWPSCSRRPASRRRCLRRHPRPASGRRHQPALHRPSLRHRIPRSLAEAFGTHSPGRQGFVRQLAWRDWYAHITHQFTDIDRRAIRPEYDGIAWQTGPAADEEFTAWAEGRTGFPIVDAGMRQLAESGWMHNRVRMITASFLVKDLLIDGDAANATSGTCFPTPNLPRTLATGSGSPGPDLMLPRTSGSSTRGAKAESSTQAATTSAVGCPNSPASTPRPFTNLRLPPHSTSPPPVSCSVTPTQNRSSTTRLPETEPWLRTRPRSASSKPPSPQW